MDGITSRLAPFAQDDSACNNPEVLPGSSGLLHEKVFSVRIFAIIPTFGSKLRDCCSNLDSVRNSTVLKRIESQYVAIFQRAKPELPTGGCRVFLSYIRPAV